MAARTQPEKSVTIKPLRTSSVASCHLPPIQFLEWKTMPFSSHFERRYFWLCGEGCQKPSENLKFPQSLAIWHRCPMPSLYPSTPRSLLLFKSRVLIIAHFTSLPPIPSHSALFFIAVRGGWYQNEIHHSTVLPPCHCFSLPMASHRAQDNRSVVCYSDLLAH